ncbi:hypothetical protein [Spirochaeta dissipatitropha]
MIKRGSLLLLDTNILLSATDASRNDHEVCRKLLRISHACGVHLCVCGQILREYMVVCTRSTDVNGLGMSIEAGQKNVNWFRGLCVFLEETEPVFAALSDSVLLWQGSGKRIHDLNLIALMQVHKVDILATLNTRDFPLDTNISILKPHAIVSMLEDDSVDQFSAFSPS